MGEGRYRALLCLVQVAVETDDGVRVEVLDPLTEEFDPAPLAELLADPEIQIVLHAGRQDVALLRREWSTELRGIFDTQVAAGFAGLRAQLGYEALLHEMVGVRLRKSASFTRWDTRPLSDEQVGYAREDVLHLLQLADALQATLRDRGRLDWALEECRSLEDASDEREPEAVFHRLPRVNSLEPSQRAVAFELVALARGDRARDRPPGAQRPRRRGARRGGQAPAARRSSAWPRSAGSTRARCAAAGARSSRPSSAGASATRSRSTATARRPPTPRTRRSSRSARRSCAPAPRSPSSPTSCIAARADLQRIVTAVRTSATSPTCARCRAGGARWSASRAARAAAGPPLAARRARTDDRGHRLGAPGTLAACAACSRSC